MNENIHPEHSEHPDKSKPSEIVVDGQIFTVADETVSFEEVVSIAYPDKAGSTDLTFVVTFRKAQSPKEGSLAEGGVVTVKNKGTIFNVTFTRRS